MALLSAARNQRNALLSQKVFDRIKNYFPNDKDYLVSATILLANTYAVNNNFEIASNIRNELNQSGMKKVIGFSSTVVNGKIVVSLSESNNFNKIK